MGFAGREGWRRINKVIREEIKRCIHVTTFKHPVAFPIVIDLII